MNLLKNLLLLGMGSIKLGVNPSHRVGLEAPYFSTGRKAPLATSVALGYNCNADTRNGYLRHW